jgi:hypothetical protein
MVFKTSTIFYDKRFFFTKPKTKTQKVAKKIARRFYRSKQISADFYLAFLIDKKNPNKSAWICKICVKKLLYLNITRNKAFIKGILGHFKITFKSSLKVVSSSRNLKIRAGFPFLNKEEKIVLPNSL